MGSTWGDFTRREDEPARTSEGPRGLVAGGIAVVVLGVIVMVMGFVFTYAELRGPNDLRGDKTVPLLWVPGAVLATIGVALLAWGWWRSSHAN